MDPRADANPRKNYYSYFHFPGNLIQVGSIQLLHSKKSVCPAKWVLFLFLSTELGLKWIRGVVSGVKSLTSPSGLALNPTSYPLIHFKPK